LSKRTVSGTMLILLFVNTLTLAFSIQPVEAGPTTIVVPDDYPTIQEAVYAAEAGDTILVLNGTYPEHLVINNSLCLLGESRSATIIKGSIRITSDNVNVSRFTIEGEDWGTGVYISSSSGCTISNNTITSCAGGEGIYIIVSSNNNIVGNTITKNGYGIWLSGSNNNTITENHILKNARLSIFVLYGSNYNKISNNIISHNYGGIVINMGISGLSSAETAAISFNYRCVGNVIMDNVMSNKPVNIEIQSCCSNTEIIRNRMTGVDYWGIVIASSLFLPDVPCNATIVNNTVTDTKYGISIAARYVGAHFNDVLGNTVVNCDCGICFKRSSNNTVYHNNFVNNTVQANVTDSHNISWDNGCEGNYWSDYNGTDVNQDGTGDAPYIIDENNRDRYPLMTPWGLGMPWADFTWTPSIPKVGDSITFDASSSTPIAGIITKYEWDLGDGETTTGKIVSHTYADSGNYTVTLNVTDIEGLWDIEKKQIEVVQPHAPKAEFTATPEAAQTGESIKFDASASLPGWNGTHEMPIVEYRWNFGDGNNTTTSTPIVYHSFSSSGIYYVTLTVYAPGAAPETDSTTHKVTVISVPVGGYSYSIKGYTIDKPLTLYLALLVTLTVSFTLIKRKKPQKRAHAVFQ